MSSKRERDLRRWCEDAGLTVIEIEQVTKGGVQRYEARVLGADGAAGTMSIFKFQGDMRGDLNDRAKIRRWANEHSGHTTLTTYQVNSEKNMAHPTVMVTRKKRGRPSKAELAERAAELEAAMAKTVPDFKTEPGAPFIPDEPQGLPDIESDIPSAGEQAERELQQHSPMGVIPDAVVNALPEPQGEPPIVLSNREFFYLTQWLKDQRLQTFASVDDIVEYGKQHGLFRCTADHIREAMDLLNISEPAVWSEPVDPITTLVREVEGIMNELGVEMSPAFTKLLRQIKGE